MIPQAGSAYAYSYATLGEFVAWIIGWDLILEYAVGNIAVAISWGGYFKSLLSGFGIALPDWLTHGYRTALLSSNPDVHGLLDTAPRIAGHSDPRQHPGGARSCWASPGCCYAACARARAPTTSWSSSSCCAWRSSSASGAMHIDPANYTPFAPNGWTGIHQGAAIVFFAYIGFDAISTAAEETQESAAQHADRHPRRPGDLHRRSTSSSASWRPGSCRTSSSAPPIRWRARSSVAGLPIASWIVALGAVVSLTAVLLVFQYGQPRIFFAMARDGLLPEWAARVHPKTDSAHHDAASPGIVVAVGSLVADENEIYDLTNIGTLSAFALVCIGVLVLRITDPDAAGRSACRSSGRSPRSAPRRASTP